MRQSLFVGLWVVSSAVFIMIYATIEPKLLSTGLEDYGFWSQEMAKQKAQQTEPDKPFRRGRIWC